MKLNLKEIARQVLLECADEIVSRMRAEGKIVSGKTASSLEVVDNILYAPSYFDVIQDGRGPGKVPYNFDDMVITWARAKGLHFDTPSQARSFAFLLAQKIRKEGTKQYRQHQHLDIYDTPADHAITKFRDEVSKQLLDNF